MATEAAMPTLTLAGMPPPRNGGATVSTAANLVMISTNETIVVTSMVRFIGVRPDSTCSTVLSSAEPSGSATP